MKLRPIPNILLGSDITLIKPTASGTAEIPVRNVRVELSEKAESASGVFSAITEILTVRADRQNSTWVEFPVGAKIRYNGKLYEITEQRDYGLDEPHYRRIKARRTGG